MTAKQNIIRDARMKLCPYTRLTCTELHCHAFEIRKWSPARAKTVWGYCWAFKSQLSKVYDVDESIK